MIPFKVDDFIVYDSHLTQIIHFAVTLLVGQSCKMLKQKVKYCLDVYGSVLPTVTLYMYKIIVYILNFFSCQYFTIISDAFLYLFITIAFIVKKRIIFFLFPMAMEHLIPLH